MNYIADSLEKMVAMAGLVAVTLAPRFQATDLGIVAQIAQLSPAALLAFLLLAIWRGELVTKGVVERLDKEFRGALEARDKRFDLMMDEHMKALEMVEKERSREREQSQASLAATIAHYEARLLERDTLLKENTALLTRAVTLLNAQQPAA